MPDDVPIASNREACENFLNKRQDQHPLLLCIIRFVIESRDMGIQVCHQHRRVSTVHQPWFNLFCLVLSHPAPAQQADGYDILRAILDVETMKDSPPAKDEFLERFYHVYMRWIVFPFHDLLGRAPADFAEEPTWSKNAKSLLCDLMSLIVKMHGFRIKYFCIKNNIIAQILQMCKFPNG